MKLRHALTSVVMGVGLAVSSMSSAAERIVSADNALTEIVYALGAGDQVVGVDTTSRYPSEAAKLPQVGYKRALAAEGVLSLSPTLLIATEDSGPPVVLEQVKEAGVTVDVMSAAPTLAAVEEKIGRVANLLGRTEQGEQLWTTVQAEVADAKARVAAVQEPLRVLFILSYGDHGIVVGGANTGADQMLKMAGAVNVASGIEGYKPMTPEAIIAARPQQLVVMSGGRAEITSEQLWADPALSLTPAAESRRVLAIGGAYMLGYGPRIGQALNTLTEAFYPELADTQ